MSNPYFDPTPHLVGHFIYNLWGAPNQDNQSIVRPDRVTPFGGARNYVSVFREDINLPTKNERYHAYVIGQVSEHILNLPFYEWYDKTKWTNMADYCKESKMLFQFYTVKGIMIPLTHVFFTVTLNKNLIFVVKEDLSIPWDMNVENITFRTYKNAVFNLPVQGTLPETVDITYLKVLRQSQRQQLNDFYRKYSNKTGKVFTYVNGFIVKDPLSHPILENDIVEMIYDSTIVKSIEMRINQIPTFQSIKDGIRKYLFTHDKSYKKNLFEYFDDCDFYLSIYPDKTPSLYKGVVIHRNDESNIRQVTNCDFSISSNLVKEMILNYDFIDQQLGQLVFQVYYRKQYKEKKFPYVHNRLHELNKLPFRNRIAALTGARSNIPEWRADVLENSDLMNLVSLDKPICDLERVQNVYGYNAATWYTAKSVHPAKDFKLDGTTRYVEVPYSFRPASTIFEYDETGKLLGWYRLGNFRQYPIKDPKTHYVEFIGGIGTRQPHHYYGNASEDYIIPDIKAEYRFYGCDENLASTIDHDLTTWEDVTGRVLPLINQDPVNGTTTIRIEAKYNKPSDTRPMYEMTNKKFVFRTDRDFLCREVDVNIVKNTLSFTLMQAYWDEDEDKVKEQPVKIPYGYLDVFLNGHALIENVDYFVDFPKVYIINKGCINQSTLKQKILYRMYAFPDTKTHINQANQEVTHLTGITNANRQVGYVNNSMLSRNNRWDILEEKNLLIKVGNGIIAKEDLGFSEDGSVIPKRTDVLEGKPYEIQDVISGKTDAYVKDSYKFKEEAEELDKRISDYMTQFFKDKPFNSNPPIQGLYKLYSPFLSRLLYDFVNNQVSFPNIEGRYLDQEVIDFVEQNYHSFFKIEPAFRLDEISLKHCTIHPTYKDSITTIGYHQMRLLKAILRIYYRNSIEVSHFVRIGD